MNILHLSAVANWGGGENHLQNLCTALKDPSLGVRNIILCNAGGQFHKRLQETELTYYPGHLLFKMDPRYIFKIRSLCKSEKIDLIHIHDTTALTLAVMAGHLFRLPPFVFSKKTSFPVKSRKQTLYKYNYYKIKKILCVSKTTATITLESIQNKDKIEVVYHGTNTKVLENVSSLNLRKKLNLGPETFIIGNIANHIRAKDLETFVRTAAEVIKEQKFPQVHFVQIGAFTNRTSTLKNLTRELHLENYISFLGEQRDAAGLIPQFDISFLSSQSEGLPQFILESLYHRIPVVSTNVGGIPEIIEDRVNGLLSPAHDYKGLANNLIQLVQDKDLRRSLTKRSRETVEDKFTSHSMALKTLDIYKEIKYGSDKTGN
ncbi:glycosyltransferase family 4 protein [Antarcticibacterium arcticum]|uniref:Glycosyltransferase family 4 protein n=1 Tax=Antarcticibacterium arcticum TaxID=2585771 RepID=A0A5B8YLC6_9FLAO|nr:glycosyltransferase family 4 protein [Antarcticibacterium arcticum]QED37443.1 glycosyltransferase family 4 protein [Antarcticibacterium arcticum]